jgi:hypothetical protein
MKNRNVAEQFVRGNEKLKTQHLFIEGNVLYSYGYHFPMAIRLVLGNEFKFILNNDKYSRTTSRHKTELLRELSKEDILSECNTGEMQKIAESKVKSVKELMANNLQDEAIKI